MKNRKIHKRFQPRKFYGMYTIAKSFIYEDLDCLLYKYYCTYVNKVSIDEQCIY